MRAKSNAGRKLAALRQRYQKNCAVCHREMVALKQAKYCSNRCRQRAKYRRQKSIEENSRATDTSR